MKKHHPFLASRNISQDKEAIRDPLEVRELLTDNSRRAVVTADGELQLQDETSGESSKVELIKERYWGAYQAMFDHRLSLESRTMLQKFPQFQLRRADSKFRRHGWTVARKGEIFWSGNFRTSAGGEYSIALVYRSN